ncbi:hypothetical protein [Nonomuraea terrae]|uniref:hypothetical protein n=1 Tax=Nonomuraea terrae TaxID=2530383 RepID=UPI001CB6D6F2|nr:hypothetical protein [Nonomuraea terrae]
MAQVLRVPHDDVMLAAFIPLAYTIGTDFKPARRIPREEILRWERWWVPGRSPGRAVGAAAFTP